jgi:hypothetical protein
MRRGSRRDCCFLRTHFAHYRQSRDVNEVILKDSACLIRVHGAVVSAGWGGPPVEVEPWSRFRMGISDQSEPKAKKIPELGERTTVWRTNRPRKIDDPETETTLISRAPPRAM